MRWIYKDEHMESSRRVDVIIPSIVEDYVTGHETQEK